MLVLQRKNGQTIRIGDDIVLSVVSINRTRVRIAIDAPKEVSILRGELLFGEEGVGDALQDDLRVDTRNIVGLGA